MDFVGMILMAVGGIIMLVGSIWFLVVAFQESLLWGLGCIFVPFVSLVFLIMHWGKAGKPFLVQLAGLVPMIAASIMMGASSGG